jgi:hypothetical protein
VKPSSLRTYSYVIYCFHQHESLLRNVKCFQTVLHKQLLSATDNNIDFQDDKEFGTLLEWMPSAFVMFLL